MEGNNEPQKDANYSSTPNTSAVTAVVAPATNEDAPKTATEPGVEVNETTIMAALSYFGPLVFIPFFLKKSDPFVYYHVKQGFVVFAIGAISWVFGSWFMVMSFLYPLLMLINLGVLILSIIGIIHTLKREEKPLPLVGKFAHYFNF